MQSISRRTMFAGAAALAATLPNTLEAFAVAAPGVTIGVATYSLRKFQRPQAIEILKKLNVQALSVKEFHLHYTDTPAQIAEGVNEFKAAGLKILSGGNIGLAKPEELRKMFDYAKAAGLPMMVCAPSHETLPEVEKLVKEYNIKAAIHNHGPEDKHFPSPQSVLAAVKNMDPRMGLCIDIGHTTRAKADLVASIKEAGPRLFDMHAKDLVFENGKWTQVAVGDGHIPIVEMFKTLKALHYTGGVMLEYEINADDPYPGMERSLSYMRGVRAALGA
ncbi:sugar phosphate isomerase/epimerase [uncultured Paludibaculum sp.]|uniref:sugar phosphate isomerase/epimerase family protein n=1 Tax=uncultured Paludibaculum sp. TaxID=1765020 RepID=UPI002AAC1647|nr:sugar phosphate isomerase/epimerase [uncultured Paludibaculum sp.]